MAGIGYGKVILFGEHFVVYKKPAIVAGLKNLKKLVEVDEGKWNDDFDAPTLRALARIAKICGFPEKTSFRLEISGNVPLKQNLGSSAALCVAFARALDSKYGLGMDDAKINHAAYEGEKEFHGNPSGIDTSAATYGSVFSFRKVSDKEFSIRPIRMTGLPLQLLIVNTGEKKKGTAGMVSLFKKVMESDSAKAETLFERYSELYSKALKALETNNIRELGHLMSINHGILTQFDISTEEIDHAIHMMDQWHALGSKITGAGGGGNIIGLFKTRYDAKKAKEMFEKEGLSTLYVEIE